MRLPNEEFWVGKRVLVTGHTGFKGAWLSQWLLDLGAIVCGLSLDPISTPNLWDELGNDLGDFDVRMDIRGNDWQKVIDKFEPEIAFHLAAQALVVTGWKDPSLTFETNVGGLIQFLEWANKSSSLRSSVIVTSDKVYKLDDTITPRRESDELGGADPYSASKAAAELVAHAWPVGENKAFATARSGNVIGGGDWAEDRLIPDLVRAWQSSAPFVSRNPKAIRPWQHVIEPLSGYLLMAEDLDGRRLQSTAYNFGPSLKDQITVEELVNQVRSHLPASQPLNLAETEEATKYEESKFLRLNSELATKELGWRSVLASQDAIELTIDWYLAFSQGAPAKDLVRKDLRFYKERVSANVV